MRKEGDSAPSFAGRRIVVSLLLLVCALGLATRAVWLHVVEGEFLRDKGKGAVRNAEIAAHRGTIVDREGALLALSTPVISVGADPARLSQHPERWQALADLLERDRDSLRAWIEHRRKLRFAFLERQMDPQRAARIERAAIPGVELRREFRRYYPTGEIAAGLLGYTDADDAGQAGIELAYEEWLRGVPGGERLLWDRAGHAVEHRHRISEPRGGRTLRLSLDRTLQYASYRALLAGIKRHNAHAGAAVALDVDSGEVLAIVNYPSFNPNDRGQRVGAKTRNRAVTDLFEPGSTLKSFTVAAALESGKYRPDTLINTSPGFIDVGDKRITEYNDHDYGLLDVAGVVQKSSNVGVAKIALSLEGQELWGMLNAVGLSRQTGSGFPGEAVGVLRHWRNWSEVDHAVHAYGYGVSLSLLQLARAYAAIAADGELRPVTFQRLNAQARPAGERVMSEGAARALRMMLTQAAGADGTGGRARIAGYRVAGKTGTVNKLTAQGYSEALHSAVFAGMAPASRPRFVVAVMIDEPQGPLYTGGIVAAPIFAEIMAAALRRMGEPPGAVEEIAAQIARAGERT